MPDLPSALLILLIFLLGSASGLSAQSPDQGGVALPEIEAKIKLWSSSAVDPGLQKRVLPLAEEASNRIQQAAQYRQQAGQYREQTQKLPVTAAALKESASQPATLPASLKAPPATAGISDLEAAVSALETALAPARQQLVLARSLPQQNAARRQELNAVLSEANPALIKLTTEALPTDPTQPAEWLEARTLSRKATIAATQAKIDAAEAELAWLDAAEAINWPSLQLSEANRQLVALEAAGSPLRSRLDQLRSQSAATTLEKATREEAEAPAALQPVLEAVRLRAAENQHIIEVLIPQAEEKLRALQSDIRHWVNLSAGTREKIRRLGPSGIIGVELRQQRQALPTPASLTRDDADRQENLTKVELARLALDEVHAGLPVSAADAPSAAKAERESILTLQQTYARYYNVLVRLEESSQQYRNVIRAHRSFIHENILWMPSTIPVGPASLASLGVSSQWLARNVTDPALASSWWQGVRQHPLASTLTILLLGGLYWINRTGRHRLAALARLASQPDPGFFPTLAAVVWTAAIALPWPVLLWAASLPWLENPHAPAFALTLATALHQTALTLLGVELVRQPLHPDGLAPRHFAWPGEVVRQLRWQFRRLILILIPCSLAASIFQRSDEIRHDAAGRVCLVVVLVAAAWWLHRFWKIAGRHTGLPRQGLSRLLWHTGYALCIFVPLALAVLALRGYLLTAEVLTVRLAITLLTGAGFLLLRALFLRWYFLHRQQLRKASARKLRENREASRAAAAAPEPVENLPPGTITSDPVPEPAPDVITGPEIDDKGQQMRGLVDIIVFAGIVLSAWSIWADVLPAARNLADRPLDSLVSLQRDHEDRAPDDQSPVSLIPGLPLTAPAPAAGTAEDPEAKPVSRLTWWSFFIALAAAGLTLASARRIPGAIEFVMSSQLQLDAGARFALSTVTRYAILITGLVFTLGLLGITWSSVQWLAAALTVGLGFGLQEIFANFFSGLIILIERPIRPGDTVTIDNITGTVSRIQIRATTIRAPDGKDYIVPNKEFITGKLLNWTHTDTATRQEISVGISYQSDPATALGLLASAAADHPAVLKDPAPIVSFEGFGDNALLLRLRFHVGTLAERLSTLTDLHCAILRSFAAADIDIPFPQREVRLHGFPESLTKSDPKSDPPAGPDRPGT